MDHIWTITAPDATRYTCLLAWSPAYGDWVTVIYDAAELADLGDLSWLAEPVAILGWDGEALAVAVEDWREVRDAPGWLVAERKGDAEQWAAGRATKKEAA